jgi:Ca2+-binding RTX toxin-like protein
MNTLPRKAHRVRRSLFVCFHVLSLIIRAIGPKLATAAPGRRTAPETKRQLRARLSFCLVALSVVLAIGSGEDVFAKTSFGSPTIVNIAVVDPGALYIATSDTAIGFWVLTSVDVTRVDEIPIIDPGASRRLIVVNLSGGVTGVFYAGDLPLSPNLQLSFEGGLENPDCAECTVTMPLPSDGWSDSLWASGKGGSIADSPELMALVDRQNEIFNVTQKVKAGITAQEAVVRDMMAADLTDLYNRDKETAKEVVDRVASLYKQGSSYEKDLYQPVMQDSSNVQQTADAYLNYLSTQTIKIGMTGNCTNTGQFWAREASLEKALMLDQYPDPLPDNFDADNSPPANREDIITAAENDFFQMQNQIEPCVTTLLGGMYTTGENIDVPNAVPNLSQENLISQAAYERIGNHASAFVDSTDAGLIAWQASLQDRFENTNKLEEYKAIEQSIEKSATPLFDFMDPEVVAGKTWEKDHKNVDKSKKKAGGDKAKHRIGLSNCGDDWVVKFNLFGVSVLIGTPGDDSVTAGNDKNLIITLGGDDCVQGGDDFDVVLTMAGDDKIYGGGSHNALFGGKGADTIYSEKGKTYTVTIGAVTLTFDIGSLISGDAGDDTLIGGTVENDALDIFGDADVILGDGFAEGEEAGADTIDGKKGVNFIFSQEKDDVVSSSGFGRVTVEEVPAILGSVFWTGTGEDTITGTSTPIGAAFGDVIVSGEDKDTIFAASGEDVVFALDGNDNVNGGDGNDVLALGTGNDTAHGDDGIDFIFGEDGADLLFSDSGIFAVMTGNNGEDTITGGPGVDLALGNGGNDAVNGGAGFDIIAGSEGVDNLDGSSGSDMILGGDGNDVIKTGDGPFNAVFAGNGVDNVTGGTGLDIIFGMDNNQLDRPDQFCTPASADVERLFGGGGMDFIVGGKGCDAISGDGGVNALIGGDSSDIITGGNSIDLMWGGRGIDTILGNDGLDVGFGGDEADNMSGGTGIDVLSGGSGNDVVDGDSGSDLLIGNTGNDTLNGGPDPNLLIGGDQDDVLNGGLTSSVIFGGSGRDTSNAGSGPTVHFGGSGGDTLNGGGGADVIFGDGDIDNLNGFGGNDIIFGGDSGDAIDGRAGNNLNFGNDGGDTINNTGGSNVVSFGNSGSDIIDAAQGRVLAFGNGDGDTIHGGCAPESPRDFLFGDSGSDTLTGTRINSRDVLFLGSGGSTKNFC